MFQNFFSFPFLVSCRMVGLKSTITRIDEGAYRSICSSSNILCRDYINCQNSYSIKFNSDYILVHGNKKFNNFLKLMKTEKEILDLTK